MLYVLTFRSVWEDYLYAYVNLATREGWIEDKDLINDSLEDWLKNEKIKEIVKEDLEDKHFSK